MKTTDNSTTATAAAIDVDATTAIISITAMQVATTGRRAILRLRQRRKEVIDALTQPLNECAVANWTLYLAVVRRDALLLPVAHMAPNIAEGIT